MTKLPVKEIIRHLKLAEIHGVEFHETVYSDGIWDIIMERHPDGRHRIWVSREDSYGNYNATLVTIYRYNGELRMAYDFKICKNILKRLTSVYTAMEREGLVK